MHTTRFVPTLVATLLLCACPGPDPIDDPHPDPDPIVTPHALTGTYQVTSQFEVPATVAAPGPLGDALRLLHQLAENPAAALLDLAETAGVPSLGTLRAVLPSTLEDELEGWMNGYLDTSSQAELVALDDLIRSVLLDWELDSTLELPAGAGADGTHAPTALVFSAGGAPIVVPVDVTAPVTAATGVTATVTVSDGGVPRATFGDHAMGIPFGHYALQALEIVTEERYGTPGIRAALGATVDCAAMAGSVADQCVGFICVGHEADLEAICEGGLDEAADQLEARILEIDYKAVHLQSGTATVEGIALSATGATATALTEGTWTATVDLAQGSEEDAVATFTAVR